MCVFFCGSFVVCGVTSSSLYVVWVFDRCDLTDNGTEYNEGGADEGGSRGEAVLLILATDGLWEFITDQVIFLMEGSEWDGVTYDSAYQSHY